MKKANGRRTSKMNIKKGDSLITVIERVCHKQTLARGMPNPNKSGCCKKPQEWSSTKKKLIDGDTLLHYRKWEFAK